MLAFNKHKNTQGYILQLPLIPVLKRCAAGDLFVARGKGARQEGSGGASTGEGYRR